MNCGDREEKLALYAGGDLPPAEAAAVERHLAECAGCQLFASGLKEAFEFFKEAHQEALSPADFTAVRARVLAELEGEHRPLWKRAWVFALVAAGVLLIALAGRFGQKREVPAAPVVAKSDAPASPERLSKNAGEGIRGVPKTLPHTRRVRARRKVETGEPVLIRLVSNDPDVVIYWIANTRGE